MLNTKFMFQDLIECTRDNSIFSLSNEEFEILVSDEHFTPSYLCQLRNLIKTFEWKFENKCNIFFNITEKYIDKAIERKNNGEYVSEKLLCKRKSIN